jgi:hypothetical protein
MIETKGERNTAYLLECAEENNARNNASMLEHFSTLLAKQTAAPPLSPPPVPARGQLGRQGSATVATDFERFLQADTTIDPAAAARILDFHRLESGQAQSRPSTSPLPFSAEGLEMVSNQQTTYRKLYNELEMGGLAASSGSAATETGMAKIIKDFTAKETKGQEGKKLTSYKDFCDLLRNGMFLTPTRFREDPDSFWAIFWHKNAMEFINNEFDFPTAKAYHIKVLERWRLGHLKPAKYTDGEEFQRGDTENCLDQPAEKYALRHPFKSSKARHGTKDKESPSDTYCGFHKEWYPHGEDHRWSNTSKTGTCRAAQEELDDN